MVVKYDGRPPPAFVLKFPDATFDSLRVSWAQLLGAEPWGATRMHTLELQPVGSVSSSLVAQLPSPLALLSPTSTRCHRRRSYNYL